MRLLYFILLGLSLLSAWFGVHQLLQFPLGNFQGFAMVGMSMLLIAWVVAHPLKDLSDVDANSIQARIARRFDTIAEAMLKRPLIYVAMALGALTVALATKPALQPWPILILWTTGIVLFVVGTATPDIGIGTRATVSRVVEWIRVARWELLAVVTLTIIAFLCRGIALGDIPHNVHGDEGEMGLLARSILRGELRDPFTTAFLGHPSLWFFIQALALRLFGDNIAGLRTLSALIGALAIPALYVFARPLYGRTVAILSAVFLAFYHVHIHYSRIGLNNIVDPLMTLLTLAAFFYGYRRRSLVGFGLAGVLMGLAQYFYYGTRLILVILFVLVVFLVIKERRQLQRFFGSLAGLAVGFLITIGPLMRYYLANPVVYYSRMTEHGLFQRGNIPDLQANGQSFIVALLEHAYRTFGLFVTYNEHSPFYDSGLPLLSHGMELLFIVGIVLVLLNWRKMENFTLLLWVAGTATFGGFLLWDSPLGQRYLIATPALCLLMALALVQINTLLSQIIGLSQRLQIGFIALILGAFSFWNLYFYFAVYTPLNKYALMPTATEIGYYLQERSGKSYAYMFTPPALYLDYATIEFVARNPPGTNVLDPLTSLVTLQEPPPGLRPVFIFIPDRLNELTVVKQRYSDGKLQQFFRPQDREHPYLYIYEPR
jgi:hypothetical protein